ncbi:hypothetical protein ABC195_13035 [Microbacterium sp. 2P01SA-2]|uniref:hypothetical protein n=1 Tax=unclassified Microbacterium TaxID=2609290 RepID=UPI0039A0E2B3
MRFNVWKRLELAAVTVGIAGVVLVGCAAPDEAGVSDARVAESFAAMYTQWLTEPDLTEMDRLVLDEAQRTGRVTQGQYQDAIDRLVSCMADAGYALQLTTYPSGVIEVQPPVAVPDGDDLMSSKHFCEKTTSIYAIMGYEMQQGNPELYADPAVVAFNCLEDADLLASTATVDDVKRFMYSSERDNFPFDSEDFGVKACFYGAGMAYGTVAEAE